MGIQVEFNPDLCLRAHGTEGRLEDECLPEELNVGFAYSFLKRGHRYYWMKGEIPLRETDGEGHLSRPLASVKIHQVTLTEEDYTEGFYTVMEVYDPEDPRIHFEGYEKVERESGR
ncbi:MAG: hypothetical protein Q8P81_00845 [Nanoarchaeota archaeon]|nr:hypothetical protein [Nanoarchaeota archaeon]